MVKYLVMDSAIEISSGSSSSSGSGSDDEVSEPTRTRSNTSWLYGTITILSALVCLG